MPKTSGMVWAQGKHCMPMYIFGAVRFYKLNGNSKPDPYIYIDTHIYTYIHIHTYIKREGG